MNKLGKIAIVVVLIAAVIVVISIKQYGSSNRARGPDAARVSAAEPGDQQVPAEYMPEQITGKGLPALIDIGAGTCIPCKLMAPILDELKEELQGKIVVQFIDLNKFPNAARVYGIRVMPTQIFYDATGKGLFRHEGFYSKEDILAKWKELGVDLAQASSQLPAFERLAPAENLKKWVSQHPHETGRLISIAQALADKMKLSPEQIQKACKIGECLPK